MAILRVRASALIEVIISMLLVSAAFAVMMTVLLKLSTSYSVKERTFALSVLHAETNAIRYRQVTLIDNIKEVAGLEVRSEFNPYPGFDNLVSCRISIYSRSALKLADHTFLITL